MCNISYICTSTYTSKHGRYEHAVTAHKIFTYNIGITTTYMHSKLIAMF